MPTVVTKKVRLPKDVLGHLREVARSERTTESEVLRRGVEMQYRVLRRRKAVEGLIAMIEGPEPPKVRWRPK